MSATDNPGDNVDKDDVDEGGAAHAGSDSVRLLLRTLEGDAAFVGLAQNNTTGVARACGRLCHWY